MTFSSLVNVHSLPSQSLLEEGGCWTVLSLSFLLCPWPRAALHTGEQLRTLIQSETSGIISWQPCFSQRPPFLALAHPKLLHLVFKAYGDQEFKSLKLALSQFIEQNLLPCSERLSERGATVISLVGSTQLLGNLAPRSSISQ